MKKKTAVCVWAMLVGVLAACTFSYKFNGSSIN